MDLTLQDSDAQFEEDLALIRGTTQVNGTARRLTNVTIKSDDDDSVGGGEEDEDDNDDVENSTSVEGMSSDTETKEKDFEEVVNSDDTNNLEFGIPVRQTYKVLSECGMGAGSNNNELLQGNAKKVNNNNNNNVLNNNKSGGTTEDVTTKKSVLKWKKNETEICSVSNIEQSKCSKGLLVRKRKLQNAILTDGEECGDLEGYHERDSENESVNLINNLKIKTRKQRHDSVNIRCKSDERLVHNVCSGGDSVDSFSENCAGEIVDGEERGEVGEFWEDIYGRTRDKQGNVIQVRTGQG
jgi:hypothetical protein